MDGVGRLLPRDSADDVFGHEELAADGSLNTDGLDARYRGNLELVRDRRLGAGVRCLVDEQRGNPSDRCVLPIDFTPAGGTEVGGVK